MPISHSRYPSAGSVAFGLEPPPNDFKFLSSAFNSVDSLLDSLYDYNGTHPLKEIVYETSMLLRELLNSWSHTQTNPHYSNSNQISEEIGDVAFESFINRNGKIMNQITTLSSDSQPKHFGTVEVQTLKANHSSNFVTKAATINFYLLHLRGDKHSKTVDLRNLISVEEIHTGQQTADFVITMAETQSDMKEKESAKDKDKDRDNKSDLPFGFHYVHQLRGNFGYTTKPSSVTQYVFKTISNADRAKWVNIFRYYVRTNRITTVMYHHMSVKDRIDIHRHCIFRPYGMDPTKFESIIKRKEFLFSTVGHNQQNSNNALNHQRAWSNFHSQYRLGIRERFSVQWIQKIGSNKVREVEFDLSNPPVIRIYRNDQKNAETIIQQAEVIDFRVNTAAAENTFEMEFSYCLFNSQDKKRHHRRYLVDSQANLQRFYDLFQFMQMPIEQQPYELIHEDVILILKQYVNEGDGDSYSLLFKQARALAMEDGKHMVNPSHGIGEKEIRDSKSLLYRDHLHQLIRMMSDVSPSSSVIQSLYSKSCQLGFTHHDDIGRLTALAQRLNAIHERFNITTASVPLAEFQCECPASFALNRAQFGATNNCILFLIQSMLHCDGMQDLLYLSHSRHSEIQQLAIKILFVLYEVRNSLHKCRSRVDGPMAEALFHYLNQSPFAYYIDSVSRRRPINSTLMSTLFELLIGGIRLTDSDFDSAAALSTNNNSFKGKMDKGSGVGHLNGSGNGNDSLSLSPRPATNKTNNYIQVLSKTIKEVAFIPYILHILPRATAKASSMALTNFILLLNAPLNYKGFLDRLGWQNWIFPLLMEDNNTDKQKLMAEVEAEFIADKTGESSAVSSDGNGKDKLDDENSSDEGGKVLTLSMSLITSLHYHSMLSDNKDKSNLKEREKPKTIQLYRTMELLSEVHGWTHDTASMFRVMMICFLNMMKHRCREYTNNYDHEGKSQQFESFFLTVDTIEEYVFYRTTDYPQANSMGNNNSNNNNNNGNSSEQKGEENGNSSDVSIGNRSSSSSPPSSSPSSSDSDLSVMSDAGDRTVVSLHYDRNSDGKSTGYLTDIVVIDKLIECLVAYRLGPSKETAKMEDFCQSNDKTISKKEKANLKRGFIEIDFWRNVKNIFIEMQKSNQRRDSQMQEKLSTKLTQIIAKRDKDLSRAGGFLGFGGAKPPKFLHFQPQIDPKLMIPMDRQGTPQQSPIPNISMTQMSNNLQRDGQKGSLTANTNSTPTPSIGSPLVLPTSPSVRGHHLPTHHHHTNSNAKSSLTKDSFALTPTASPSPVASQRSSIISNGNGSEVQQTLSETPPSSSSSSRPKPPPPRGLPPPSSFRQTNSNSANTSNGSSSSSFSSSPPLAVASITASSSLSQSSALLPSRDSQNISYQQGNNNPNLSNNLNFHLNFPSSSDDPNSANNPTDPNISLSLPLPNSFDDDKDDSSGGEDSDADVDGDDNYTAGPSPFAPSSFAANSDPSLLPPASPSSYVYNYTTNASSSSSSSSNHSHHASSLSFNPSNAVPLIVKEKPGPPRSSPPPSAFIRDSSPSPSPSSPSSSSSSSSDPIPMAPLPPSSSPTGSPHESPSNKGTTKSFSSWQNTNINTNGNLSPRAPVSGSGSGRVGSVVNNVSGNGLYDDINVNVPPPSQSLSPSPSSLPSPSSFSKSPSPSPFGPSLSLRGTNGNVLSSTPLTSSSFLRSPALSSSASPSPSSSDIPSELQLKLSAKREATDAAMREKELRKSSSASPSTSSPSSTANISSTSSVANFTPSSSSASPSSREDSPGRRSASSGAARRNAASGSIGGSGSGSGGGIGSFNKK